MWQRVLLILLVIFIIYAIIHDPTQSGNFTANLWDHITNGLSAIGTFFDSLLSN